MLTMQSEKFIIYTAISHFDNKKAYWIAENLKPKEFWYNLCTSVTTHASAFFFLHRHMTGSPKLNTCTGYRIKKLAWMNVCYAKN